MGKMVTVLGITAIYLLLLIAQGVQIEAAAYDIAKYGGKPNADISKALMSAWKEACAAKTKTKITIPKGTYLLKEVTLAGPCKAPIELQVHGTLKAPPEPALFKADGWVTIQYMDRLTISGAGVFDGQGKTSWAKNDCHKNPKCKFPMNFRFNFITNSVVRDVTSKDSKNFHVNVLGCRNVTFNQFTISAPNTSINTDGIHIGRSELIRITDSNIKTGDDCISIGEGTMQLNVERVTCGPGHGISVGSLGRYPEEESVKGITVKNCTLTNTMYGIRIKTWPSSPAPSSASDLRFEDIVMNNVGTPVHVDQEYCPYKQCSLKAPSAVKISNVKFKNIRGSSSTKLAVKLVCSKGAPCQNVEVSDIDLKFTGAGGPPTTECANVKPSLFGKQNPPLCTKKARSS